MGPRYNYLGNPAGQLLAGLSGTEKKLATTRKALELKGTIPPEAIIAIIDTNETNTVMDENITVAKYVRNLPTTHQKIYKTKHEELIKIMIEELSNTNASAQPNTNFILPNWDHRDVKEQLIAFNAHYNHNSPHGGRSTAIEEEEMISWAESGITHIKHLLNGTGRKFMSRAQFATKHPTLNAAFYHSLTTTAIPYEWIAALEKNATQPHREVWQYQVQGNRFYHTHFTTTIVDKNVQHQEHMDIYEKRDVTNELHRTAIDIIRTKLIQKLPECTVRPTPRQSPEERELLDTPAKIGTTAHIIRQEQERYTFAVTSLTNSPRLVNPDQLFMRHETTLTEREPIRLSELTTKKHTSYATHASGASHAPLTQPIQAHTTHT